MVKSEAFGPVIFAVMFSAVVPLLVNVDGKGPLLIFNVAWIRLGPV